MTDPFLGVAKLSQQNQLTLPKEVREALGVKAGEKVFFFMDEDSDIRVRKSIGVAPEEAVKID